MHLRVIYSDNRHDIVPDFMLDSLIRSRKVTKFYRYSELRWITIGVDLVRGQKRSPGYSGAERRRPPELLPAFA